jgi:hypothetical protein
MSRTPTSYRSYLLRLWQDDNGQEPIWRASLQSSLTGERQAFPSLDHLFAFLRRRADPVRVTGDEGKAEGDATRGRSGSPTSE